MFSCISCNGNEFRCVVSAHAQPVGAVPAHILFALLVNRITL